jgi:hypothetical protein
MRSTLTLYYSRLQLNAAEDEPQRTQSYTEDGKESNYSFISSAYLCVLCGEIFFPGYTHSQTAIIQDTASQKKH